MLSLAESGSELTLALSVMGRDTPVTLPIEHAIRLEAAEAAEEVA